MSGAVLDTQDTVIKEDGPCLNGAHSLGKEAFSVMGGSGKVRGHQIAPIKRDGGHW